MEQRGSMKKLKEEVDLKKLKVVQASMGSEIIIAKKRQKKPDERDAGVTDGAIDVVDTSPDVAIAHMWSYHDLGAATVLQRGREQNCHMDEIEYMAGVVRKIHTPSQLIVVMDSEPFDRDLFRVTLEALGHEGLKQEFLESVSAATVCFEVGDGGEAQGGLGTLWGRTAAGERHITPPMYHAVQTGNVEAVRELMKFGVDWRAQTQTTYLLEASHLSTKQLQDTAASYEAGLKKIDPTLLEEDKNKEKQRIANASAPAWAAEECMWSTDPETKDEHAMDPFQLAFHMQRFDSFEAFLEFPALRQMTGALALRTKLPPWRGGMWPDAFAQMHGLSSLTVCEPKNSGPAPSVLFTLTNLTHLSLADSGYTFLPESVTQLKNLQQLNVANVKLSRLPVVLMSKMRQLTSVDCTGVKIASPPQEIVKQGPPAVARYILDLEDGADENTDVLLMFIGDGEAGKTSTLLALKNTESNTARPIGVDDRTIGIDISEFTPYKDAPLRFSAWDFGGQAVYAIMQQLFMSRRALYPLLWRVRESLDISRFDPAIKCDVCKRTLVSKDQQPVYRVKGQGLCHAECASYDTLINSWTERLQFRVPGVTVVLVATHIDCASPEQVEEQCKNVAAVAQRIIERQAAMEGGIPQLKIHNGGQSLRVNNVSGEGVAHLRQQLRQVAESLDFYGEVIPASYARLRMRLREMQRRGEDSWRTWITWEVYQALGAECGIASEDTLSVATRFFHETGELRYFGAATRETNKAAVERGQAEQRQTHQLLASTVFPNPFWIVDVLRGLIRHDHNTVLSLIERTASLSNKESKVLRRRVHRLMQRGLLHKTLLPFIWNGIAGMSSEQAANEDEFRRLIALLQAFDILMDKPGEEVGAEWVVPSLSAGKSARTIDAKAFVDDGLPFVCRLVYDALPPFFDMMLVAHVMNSGLADSVDFIEGAASFRKFGDKALLFAGLGKVANPRTVFRQDMLNEELLKKVLRRSQCHVVVAATSRRMLAQLLREVSMLEEFFPGLRRLAAMFPCHSCRMKRLSLMDRLSLEAGVLNAAAMERGEEQNHTAESLFERGREELEGAEAFDIATYKYCLPVEGNADDPRCDKYHEGENRSALHEGFSLEPRINTLVPIGRWYVDGGAMNDPYNMGRMWGVPRYYEEVMMIMREVMAVMKPTPADEEQQRVSPVYIEAQGAILETNARVEERQLVIAAGQSAELPTLRSVSKFAVKHADTIVLAYTVDRELEKLLGPTAYLLQVGKNERERGGPSSALWKTARDKMVPELLQALRVIAEAVGPHVKTYSSGSDTEAYGKFQEDNKQKLAVLCKEYPALLRSEGNFLDSAYGLDSSDATSLHLALLLQACQILDAQEVSSDQEAAILEAVKDNQANVLQLSQQALETKKSCEFMRLVEVLDFDSLCSRLRRGFRGGAQPQEQDPESAVARVCADRGTYEMRYLYLLTDQILTRVQTAAVEALERGEEGEGPDPLTHRHILPCVDGLLRTSELNDLWTDHLPSSSNPGIMIRREAAERLNVLRGVVGVVEGVLRGSELEGGFASVGAEIQTSEGAIMALLTPKTTPAPAIVPAPAEAVPAPAPEAAPAPAPAEGEVPVDAAPAPAPGSVAELSAYAQMHAADLAAVWQAVPDLQGVLPQMSRSYREEGALFITLGVPSESKIFDKERALGGTYRTVALALFRCIVGVLEGAEVTVEEIEAAAVAKKAALEAQLAEVVFPGEGGMQDKFYELSGTPEYAPVSESLFSADDEVSSRINTAWDRLDVLGYETSYREVLFMMISVKTRSLSREAGVALLEQRCGDLLSVSSTDSTIRASRVEAVREELGALVADLKAALLARQALTEPMADLQRRLSTACEGKADAVLGAALDGLKSVMGQWKEQVQEVMRRAEKRVSLHEACADQKKAAMLYQVEAIRVKVEPLIALAKEKAQTASKERVALVADLQTGDVGRRLRDLREEIESAVVHYKEHEKARTQVKRKLLTVIAEVHEKRTAAYANLQRLRMEYAPAWHFGGGERAYSSRETQKWDTDWQKFIDTDNIADVRRACPAEPTKYRGDSYGFEELCVQPADPTAIFISHSSRGEGVALLIVETLSRAGINIRCTCSKDVKDKEEALYIALGQAKLLICCMDSSYSVEGDRKAEYTRADELKMDLIPALIDDFDIKTMSSWWPAEMPFLEQHSLFVDLRSVDPADTQRAGVICTAALVPTVRKLLQEWSPHIKGMGTGTGTGMGTGVIMQQSQEYGDASAPSSPLPTGSAPNSAPNSPMRSAVEEAVPQFEAQFIACEECALEGDRHTHFDRKQARALHAEWKTAELQRRAQNPDDPAVAICPTQMACSGGGHSMSVVDVIAAKVQEMTIPCPRCLSQGIFPPYCFEREACLTALEDNRNGSQVCKRCTDNVPLFELLRSEVFISYMWGLPTCPKCTKSYFDCEILSRTTGLCMSCEVRYTRDQSFNHNQLLVTDMKVRIEEEAGVTCWQDLDRLVGGKDLVKEMEAGIQYSEVVVLFLSDSYVKSMNCMKEYLFTTKHGKFIVPVLLQDFAGTLLLQEKMALLQTKDVNDALGTDEHPTQWWHESMGSLSQFKPILLVEGRQLEDVLFEVCERIQSRFHRAQRFATADDVVGFMRDYNQWTDTRKVFLAEHAYLLERHEVEAYLTQLFQNIDLDGDGLLSEDELAEYMDKAENGSVFTKEQISQLIAEADVDCDGQLTLDEFKVAMISVLEEERQRMDI